MDPLPGCMKNLRHNFFSGNFIWYSSTIKNFFPIYVNFMVLILFTIAGTRLTLHLDKKLMPKSLYAPFIIQYIYICQYFNKY